MPGAAITAYMERLPVMKAEYFNMLSDAAVLPWAKQADQRSIVKRWQAGIERFIPRRRPNLMELTALGFQVIKNSVETENASESG